MTTQILEAPARSGRDLPSYASLHDLMRRYQVRDLVGLGRAHLVDRIETFHRSSDPSLEGFVDPNVQHPLAVQFHWGHRHDFGDFSIEGRMGNHHVAVIAAFVDVLNAIPMSMRGVRVLDIGCYTGGTSLLLAAMGAEVVAIEEVRMYAEAAAFLRDAFGVHDLDVRHLSLYECTTDEFVESFDVVLFAGVLHHLSDPKLAMRIVFNCLKDGGQCLLETLSFEHDPNIRARRAKTPVDDPFGGDDPWGWNWLLFTTPTLRKMVEATGMVVRREPAIVDNRMLMACERQGPADVRRAGLSARNIR